MNRSFSKSLLLAVVIGGLAMVGSAGAADTIKIGVAGPYTGGYAAFGEQFWRGAEQASKDINAAGGVNGKMVEVIKADDACEPKQAVSVANRLMDVDKVQAVDGHYCSSSTIPASTIYADANVLVMTPGSTNPKVTERGMKGVFRMCGRDDQQGAVAANFIINNLKAKRVAVIHDKDSYGQGLADAMIDRMKQLGAKEVLYEGLTRGEKDFNSLVTKVKSVKADAVFFGGLHTEAGPLVRQLREQGITAAFISGDAINTSDFVTAAGDPKYVDGVYMTFGQDPLTLTTGRDVIAKFRASGYEPEGYTLYSYATIQALTAAMKATNSTDLDKMADWLHSHSVNTVLGEKSWDSKGDLKVSDFVMYQWDAKGKFRQL
ncbi:ABC transporter substrate-binding protein [Geopsychrobacter electrodiphilus]|uniref:ABC transporter substrate-binding protein n=1 Tax=Geopsychrobacter electrodiphilus TaxID=225196 RepID=UPI000478078B